MDGDGVYPAPLWWQHDLGIRTVEIDLHLDVYNTDGSFARMNPIHAFYLFQGYEWQGHET